MKNSKIYRTWGGRLLTAILTCSLILAGCNTGGTSSSSSSSSQSQTESVSSSGSNNSGTSTLQYASEIDKNKIMTFEISVDAASWQTMLDNAQKEEYISADITVNGTTVKNVGIRPKGNSSLSSIARDNTTDRYSFKIKFDEYVDGQTWLGLDKIVINSHYSDASYMKEYISYDIMSAAGVDSPLYAYADISVNGESWGFYLAIEDIDSGYRERTGKDNGELYKPESSGMGGGIRDIQVEGMPDRQGNAALAGVEPFQANDQQAAPDPATQQPDRQNRQFDFAGGARGMSIGGISLQYTDDEVSSYSSIFDNAKTKTDEADYQRVITALKNLSEGKDLETYVDVDATLRYFAAHTVVVNLDSYISNMAHNYYLYEENGQISILPWDYNLAFGGFQSGNADSVVNFPIDTPVSGVSMEDRPLLNQLLTVPEYMEKYHQYLQEILDSYFNNGKFEQKIDELNTLISSHVQNDPSAFYNYEKYQTAIGTLKELGVLRAQSIQGQLNGTIPSTSEGQKADSSALIDASSINLSDLGGQGGGGQGGFRQNGDGMEGGQPQFGGAMPGGMDWNVIQSAMEIIRSTENGELSEEQKTELYDLGLTDEEIAHLQSMSQFGGIPGGNHGQ